MGRKAKWTKEDLLAVFETLIEANSTITSHRAFRELLTRNENLFANQITREANGSIAYRSVDFDCLDATDDEFWAEMDSTQHRDIIEDNAAIALLKMAEKMKLLS